MKLEHNMNFENSTCGSRLPTEIYWTWQDGRVFALALAFVGLIGTGLNSLVLIGVGGNAKLGTTVNKLLIWICSMAILESIIGIGVKTLILAYYIFLTIYSIFYDVAQVVQNTVSRGINSLICKLSICLPFTFCNIILVLWSLISFYRLRLVYRAATKRKSKKVEPICKLASPQTFLPCLGICIGICIGVTMAAFSDSFVLFRACQGNCLDPNHSYEEWRAALGMIMSALTFHVPSSVCYFLIYCIVKRHQKLQKRSKLANSIASPGAMAIRMTLLTSRADRGNELSKNCSMPKIQLAPNTANSKGDLEESIDLQTVEKLHKNPKPESAQHAIPKLIRRMSTTVMSTLQVPKETFGIEKRKKKCNKRKCSSGISEHTSDLYDPSSSPESITVAPLDNISTRSSKRMKLRSNYCWKWKENKTNTPNVVLNGKSFQKDERSKNVTLRCQRVKSLQGESHRDLEASVETTSFIEHPHHQPQLSGVSSGVNQEDHAHFGGIASSVASKIRSKRRRRRNIISAKLSMVFMLLSILMVILLHFGYSKVEILFGPKGDTLTLRAFINALAFDLVLIIISPLMLLYSSKDLRKSIHVKFKKMK